MIPTYQFRNQKLSSLTLENIAFDQISGSNAFQRSDLKDTKQTIIFPKKLNSPLNLKGEKLTFLKALVKIHANEKLKTSVCWKQNSSTNTKLSEQSPKYNGSCIQTLSTAVKTRQRNGTQEKRKLLIQCVSVGRISEKIRKTKADGMNAKKDCEAQRGRPLYHACLK